MGAYDYTYLVHRVRTVLDENMDDSSLASEHNPDALSLREIIKHSIEDAARIVESVAPLHLIDSGKAFAGSIGWVSGTPGKGAGIIKLPDDFLRLVCFQMASWNTAVNEVISEDSPEYLLQSSAFSGLRGNPSRPVVAITHGAAGLQLEFYSCNDVNNTSLRKARYLPIPQFKEDNTAKNLTIELCDKLVSAIVYYSAYLTMKSLGDNDMAERMKTIAEQLMQ